MGGNVCKHSTAISDTMVRIQSTTSATDDGDAEEDFSSMLPESACSFISSVVADGAKHHSLTFNSFHAAASEFLKANSDALNNINNLKDEISSNPDLVHFITEHLNNSIDTLRFFTAVKYSLQKARDAELLVREAVVFFDCNNHEAALEKLWKFKEEGNPFTEKFIEEFKLVIERQESILQHLHDRKVELEQKLGGNVKTWRKVWKIVYYTALAGVLISALVLAALAAPAAIISPFAAAAAVATMPPLKDLVKWVWDKFQSPHEGDKEVISSLWKGTNFAIEDLNNIKARVEVLNIKKIDSSVRNAEFAIEKKEEAALKIAMVDIMFMSEKFAKNVDDLEKDVDERVKELKKRTVTILENFPDSLKKKKRFRIPAVKSIKKKKPISRKKLGRKSATDRSLQ